MGADWATALEVVSWRVGKVRRAVDDDGEAEDPVRAGDGGAVSRPSTARPEGDDDGEDEPADADPGRELARPVCEGSDPAGRVRGADEWCCACGGVERGGVGRTSGESEFRWPGSASSRFRSDGGGVIVTVFVIGTLADDAGEDGTAEVRGEAWEEEEEEEEEAEGCARGASSPSLSPP